MTDPETGTRIVSNVYKRDDIYTGDFVKDAPDLQVGHGRRLPRLVADHARRIAGRAASTRT